MRVRPIAFALLVFCVCSLASAQDWPEVELEGRWDGFSRPVQLTHANDGTGRLFVVEQAGRVWVIDAGEVLSDPFLDISGRVSCCGERGLLSVAFPPGFAVKRYFYVNYTDNSGDTAVSRFHLSGDPNRADPGSEQILLSIDQPFSNHNGGQLAFGPDGYLYIGTGDGGSGGDPQDNGQNPLKLLGKMLRIDVESGQVPYGIPDSNPFAFDDGHQPEIWALGLRNPWRFSFDRSTGDLYIADVGQNAWEEVNFQDASSAGGENYGWRIMEGNHCFDPNPCDSAGLVLPVAEYSQGSAGCSVIGGHVYRGVRWPRLAGVYLYGDYCSGRIWGLRQIGSGWENQQLVNTGRSISAFGLDELGAVYVVDYGSGEILAVTDPAAEGFERVTVPAVAHLLGSGGTPWRAELSIANSTGEAADVDLVFSDGGVTLDASAVVAPGGVRTWRDVLVDLFQLDPDDRASGVVEISSTVPVAAVARSYASAESGTFGQFLPGLTGADGIGPGQVGVIPQLARTDERYTNLGAVNLSAIAITISVALRGENGEALGASLVIELDPGEWKQLNDVLDGHGNREAASARIEVLSPEGRAWAYASIIDRTSRDPTTIPMQSR